MSDIKQCSVCNESKSTELFTLDKRKPNGRSSRCYVCHAKISKKWRSDRPNYKPNRSPNYMELWRARNKEFMAISNKNWREANKDRLNNWLVNNKLAFPEKFKARSLVNTLVKSGKLIRPQICEMCKAHTRVEGHHYLGYVGVNAIKVKWLCKKCHHKAESSSQ